MHRRRFLQYSVSSCFAGGLFSTTASAEQKTAISDGPQLLPAGEIPQGKALPDLPVLKNESDRLGEFHGTLIAQEHEIPLTSGTAPTRCQLYNGQLPGPLIELEAGMKVTLTFINRLKEASTIHWHGLPVPSSQDGGPEDPIAPGETRVYRFTLPDDISGSYWYHPHPLSGASAQISKGLAGPIIIRHPQEKLRKLPEQHWVISDLRLDTQGQIPANSYADWVDGREGENVLINGQRHPQITLDGQQRIRVWNMCSARYLQLSLPGAQWLVVGTDGGLSEKVSAPQHTVLLAPGERLELLVIGESKTYSLNLLPYDRHRMMSKTPTVASILATVSFSAGKSPVTAGMALRAIPALPEGTGHLRALMSEKMADIMKNKASGVPPKGAFLINGRSFDVNRMDLHTVVNQVDNWQIINATTMDHPFHIHGGQFQVVQRSLRGVKTVPEYLSWKDTINLQPGEIVMVRMRQTSPGMRMYHCHIIEHEELGMMGNLMVS